MEIKGLGNSFIPVVTQEKAVQSNERRFKQVLNSLVKPKQPIQTAPEDNNDQNPAKEVLAFLKQSDTEGLVANIQAAADLLQTNQADPLQMVKNLLGISDQKWSEMVAEIESKIKEKLDDQDPSNILMAGLLSLTMNQQTTFSDNMILFLKAAKAYSLLSNQDVSTQGLVAGLLDSVQELLQGNRQNGQSQAKQTYLQNTFSQALSDIKGQSASADQSNRVKEINQVTDWNAGSSFFQQMSKPEQFAVMGGTAKTDSVNDLIQQFEEILSKSQFSKTGGVQKLFIKLNPENLGSIRIELIQKDQALTARILTTTDAAKDALESHLHNLKHAFEAQNIKVTNVEINQQPTLTQQDSFFNRGQSDQQEQPQEQNRETDDQDEPGSNFILTLEEAILNQEV